jgi:hypothetical protein
MSYAILLLILVIFLSCNRRVTATNDFPTAPPIPAFPLNLPYPPSPTPTPTPPPNYIGVLQQNTACCLLSSALSICTSLTPGFTTLPPTQQASCLCYSSTLFQPTIFDGAVKGCADYAITAAPGAYGAIEGLEGFCSNIGAGTGIAGTETRTSSETLNDCAPVSTYLSSCVAQTSNFLNLESSAQVECLCYTTDAWGGVAYKTDFDNAVEKCVKVAETLNAALLEGISGLKGFCADAGATTDVGLTVSVVVTNQPGGMATSTVVSGGGHGGKTNTLDVTITVGGNGAGTGKPVKGDASKNVSVGDAVMICFLITVLVFFLC